eukprot:UN26407
MRDSVVNLEMDYDSTRLDTLTVRKIAKNTEGLFNMNKPKTIMNEKCKLYCFDETRKFENTKIRDDLPKYGIVVIIKKTPNYLDTEGLQDLLEKEDVDSVNKNFQFIIDKKSKKIFNERQFKDSEKNEGNNIVCIG